jgi:tryptophan synthase alpha chain
MIDGASRLATMFAEATAAGGAAFLPYMTAGLPSVADSPGMFSVLAAAGADGFEVGIPYADPLMDGPVIQEAGARSLAAGTTLDGGLEIVATVAAETGKPVIVMSYVNPILRRGVDRFCAQVAEAGGSGVIVPDVPADEAAELREATSRHGLGLALFAAPTTDERRLADIAAARPSFVYGVADLGVTGERREASTRIDGLAARVRAATSAPLVLGVGISTPEQASVAAGVADGVIVGTALVHLVLDAATAGEARHVLGASASRLAAAIHAGR